MLEIPDTRTQNQRSISENKQTLSEPLQTLHDLDCLEFLNYYGFSKIINFLKKICIFSAGLLMPFASLLPHQAREGRWPAVCAARAKCWERTTVLYFMVVLGLAALRNGGFKAYVPCASY